MIARLHHDERGIIVSFFIKLILVLAVVGIAAVDTTAVLWARYQAQELADAAAFAATERFSETGSVPAARERAAETIHERAPEARLGKAFAVRPDGSVRVTVVRDARTLVIQHLPYFDRFTVARAEAVGNPPI